jgi:hypothetical protein
MERPQDSEENQQEEASFWRSISFLLDLIDLFRMGLCKEPEGVTSWLQPFWSSSFSGCEENEAKVGETRSPQIWSGTTPDIYAEAARVFNVSATVTITWILIVDPQHSQLTLRSISSMLGDHH